MTSHKGFATAEKFAFTWRWAADPIGQETLVSLEFRDLGDSTEIALTHGHFSDTETREKHNHGGNGCFTQLENCLA